MFGVYVHFPYCRKRCPYCDFAIHVRRRIPHDEYAAAIGRELEARAPLFDGRDLVSLYFGGGTPSLWAPECVARVIDAARGRFAPKAPIEVTLEGNPDDLEPSRLGALWAAGVNRLSLGAQTFDPERLVSLGRLHSTDRTRAAVEEARAAGFENLSLDLIYGLPRQSIADLDRDLDALLALAPEHASIYQLTVEERTAFGAYLRRGDLPLPDPDLGAAMFERIDAQTRAAGLVRYEVSSYARAGRRSIHNSLYWRGGEWLGLGTSAHSFRRTGGSRERGERWSTVKNVDQYLGRIASLRVGAEPSTGSAIAGGIVGYHEALDTETVAREAIWLGLRLLDEGVDRRAFGERFGFDPAERFAPVLGPLVAGDLVAVDGVSIRLTARGALLADEVALRFL